MVEQYWTDLDGQTIRYADAHWVCTGDVEIERDGRSLAVEAVERDDVKQRTATLYFTNDSPPGSINPGRVGEYFNRIERDSNRYTLLITTNQRTYRYRLTHISYN